MCAVLPLETLAADERSEALAAFQSEAQRCKNSSTQQVTFELESVPGKPASEPATPEELERVKRLLAESGLPFDPKEHRATYEFTLALIRAKNVAVFRVTSADPKEDLSAARDCLAKLSSSVGLEYRYDQ
jgi:non-homologous end joining protein Ku